MAKTARELSKQELRNYRPWQSLKDYHEEPGVTERRGRAWKIARAVAEHLRTRYGARKVAVFGSLAKKALFTPWSDIDLAVWGIAPEDYYSAAGEAMDIGLEQGIRVDVIDPESWGPELLAEIKRRGVQL